MTPETWILMAFLLVILTALAWMIRLLLAQYTRCRVHREAILAPAPAIDPECGCTGPRAIVNPSKRADLNALKAQVERVTAEIGVSQIQWCETGVEDPGTGQALHAIALGASLVITAGGDGAARTAAASLAGMGVRMGVIPVGTDNLLARNLELPIDDVPTAIRVTLGNEHRLVDCGWLRVDGVEEPSSLPTKGMLARAAHTCLYVDERIELPEPESLPSTSEFSFIVISGLGFDGETMAKADSELKKRTDRVACVIAALGTMAITRTGMRVILRRPHPSDDPVGNVPAAPSSSGAIVASTILEGEELSDAPKQRMAWIESKPLMFTDYEGLPYVALAPGAHLDDGLLDAIAVDTQAGLLGWADLSWKILFQGLGLKTFSLTDLTDQIRFHQAEDASVHAHALQTMQADGDPIGTATTMHMYIDQNVLDVPVPKVL